MHDALIGLERGESIKIVIGEHRTVVHVWLDDNGVLNTSIGDGVRDQIQIESKRGSILSIASQTGAPLAALINHAEQV